MIRPKIRVEDAFAKDLRTLSQIEVCEFGEWLTKYRHREATAHGDSAIVENHDRLLVHLRQPSKAASDLGVFGMED